MCRQSLADRERRMRRSSRPTPYLVDDHGIRDGVRGGATVKGSVYKRCPVPVERDARGARKACRIAHGSWEYVADTGRGPDGKRRQVREAGFPTKKAAADALTELLDDLRTGEYAHDERQTVAEFLAGWIESKVANGLRPTTERSYPQHLRDHLVPQLGRLGCATCARVTSRRCCGTYTRGRPRSGGSTPPSDPRCRTRSAAGSSLVQRRRGRRAAEDRP